MKTVFLIISKDIIRRNILETYFWDEFKNNNKDHRIVLIVEKGKKDLFEEMFGSDNVVIEEYFREDYENIFIKLLFFLIRNAVNSKSRKLFRKRAFLNREAGFLQTFLKIILSATLNNFRLYKQILRKIALFIQPNNQINKLLNHYKPSIVLSLSMIDNEFDIPFAIESKRRNIKLVGMVRSWDNLNNHSLLSVIPDYFVFQNEFLKECATRFQSINLDKIEHDLVGLPHYDLYYNKNDFLIERHDFFKTLGLDPDKKLLLYGGSDVFFSEEDMIKIFDKIINDNLLSDDVQMIYRPHPSSRVDLNQIRKCKGIILDDIFRQSKNISKKILFDTQKFINLLHYSDVIINTGSTLSIDGVVMNKPVICINFDGYQDQDLPYWNSVNRLYDSWDHYMNLISFEGMSLSNSIDDLVGDIDMCLKNPLRYEDKRHLIINRFVYKLDGHSGFRLAKIFTDQIRSANL